MEVMILQKNFQPTVRTTGLFARMTAEINAIAVNPSRDYWNRRFESMVLSERSVFM